MKLNINTSPFISHYKYSFMKLLGLFVRNLPSHRFGKCIVCGKPTIFFCHNSGLRGSMICLNCNSCSINRHVAKIIRNTFTLSDRSLKGSLEMLKNIAVYEASTSRPLNSVLSTLPKYVCSEYIDGIESGNKKSDGVLCEDLQNLSFPDNSFDLVITEDIFEHIRHPEQAFEEIKRVLKPGGYHIFTIPFNFDRDTFKRIDVSTDNDVYIVPPVYHGDPVRKDGIIVYTDFGISLFKYLDSIELKTEIFMSSYSDTRIDKIYDSYVFRSRKK